MPELERRPDSASSLSRPLALNSQEVTAAGSARRRRSRGLPGWEGVWTMSSWALLSHGGGVGFRLTSSLVGDFGEPTPSYRAMEYISPTCPSSDISGEARSVGPLIVRRCGHRPFSGSFFPGEAARRPRASARRLAPPALANRAPRLGTGRAAPGLTRLRQGASHSGAGPRFP